jgi:response regulator of citrate/malate metabolism
MGEDRKRDQGGKYAEEITLDEIMTVFDDVEIPVLTSKEVSEKVGCSRPAAYGKLETLNEQGELKKKSVGARAAVYIRWPDE